MPRKRKISPLEAAIDAALKTNDSLVPDVSEESGRALFDNGEITRLLLPLFRPGGRRQPPSAERLPLDVRHLPPLL